MTNLRRIGSAAYAVTLAALLLPACGGSTVDSSLAGKYAVLVHGAWNGQWAWQTIKSDLEHAGATVTTVELPGHGEDMTSIAQISMRGYVDTVEAAIDAAPKPVILVGHSMGGIVVTEAADERAAKLERLIYVTAFVPKAGDTLLGLAMQDADSHLGAALTVNMDAGTLAVADAQIADVFCADCDAAAGAELHAKYRDEPLEPFTEPATLSAGGWAGVSKFYLYATNDHAISPANQQKMTAGITWTATASIASSHSPFLSQPSVLTTQLIDFATR